MALGHDETDEYRKNLALLSDEITGSMGLFFTQLPHDEVDVTSTCPAQPHWAKQSAEESAIHVHSP